LGWRQPRLSGAEYDELLEEFVDAVKAVTPNALVQWEDFRKDNALNILERYRDNLLSFNDDIQGTGAVAVAGVLSALRATGGVLSDQRILIHGAGAAGLGIARQFQAALRVEGVSEDKIRESIGLLDSGGLLVDDREFRDDYKKILSWTSEFATQKGLGVAGERSLHDVARVYKPTVLIGASGQFGAFDQELIEMLTKDVGRPIVLPFSNPTSISEAEPKDIIAWSDGQAFVATGSPFSPVTHAGKEFQIGQGNNVFIFPGLGMGAILAGASTVSDGMISAASTALADAVLPEELAVGLLFPAIPRLRDVSLQIARAVIQQAGKEGITKEYNEDEISSLLAKNTWDPSYPSLKLLR